MRDPKCLSAEILMDFLDSDKKLKKTYFFLRADGLNYAVFGVGA